MAGSGRIKWGEADTTAVRKAVSKFNAKRTRVIKKNPALAAVQPARLIVSEEIAKLKQATRGDLKRELGKMSRYLRQGAEMPYTTREGVNTTVWQKKEIDNAHRSINAQRRAMLKKYEPSSDKGTLLTIEQASLQPRKNNVESIQPKMWDKYVQNLEKQLFASNPARKQAQYKANFLKAIEQNLGQGRLYDRIAMLDAGVLTRYYFSDAIVSLEFVYDPKDAEEIESLMLGRLEALEGTA